MNQKQEFIRGYRENQVKFSRFYALILNETDLTLPQYALLNLLIHSNTSPMTELSTKLYITKSAITNLVDRLEAKKLLRRLPHPKDRRVSLIQIETKGEKLVRHIQSRVLTILLKALNTLSEKETETINRFYGELSKVMGSALLPKNGKK